MKESDNCVPMQWWQKIAMIRWMDRTRRQGFFIEGLVLLLVQVFYFRKLKT